MALAIIERAHGPLVTTAVAREMVVYARRDGSESLEAVSLLAAGGARREEVGSRSLR